MPPEVAPAQSAEVLCVNTSALLVGFAQQGPVHGAFAHMAGSSSSQFMKGASRRRAAPGGRSVEVAARAATCPPATRWSSQQKDRDGQHRARSAFIYLSTRGTPQSQAPKACGLPPALRERGAYAHGAPPPASAKYAHACPASSTLWRANTRHRPRAFIKKSAVCEREFMSLGTKRPNPSIERTAKRLRLSPAAHVKR